METKIRLCDTCKEKVKKFNCDFCGADLCDTCKYANPIEFLRWDLTTIVYCRKCKEQVTLLVEHSSDDDIKQMKENFKGAISNFKSDFIKAYIKTAMVNKL